MLGAEETYKVNFDKLVNILRNTWKKDIFVNVINLKIDYEYDVSRELIKPEEDDDSSQLIEFLKYSLVNSEDFELSDFFDITADEDFSVEDFITFTTKPDVVRKNLKVNPEKYGRVYGFANEANNAIIKLLISPFE